MKAETLLVAGVEVGVERQARGGAGLDERQTEAIGAPRIDGCERAADAVRIGRAAALILTLLEEGEHVAPRPSRRCPAPPNRHSWRDGRVGRSWR